MSKENNLAPAIEPMIRPWLKQNLIPDPIPVISLARATGISAPQVFAALEQEPIWLSANGTQIKTQLEQTTTDLRNQSLRQLRSQVPRNKDRSFTRFIWGEKNRAVVYRSRRRNPQRQSYLDEVKARTKIIFVTANPQQEIRQNRQAERQQTKQRLAQRWQARATKFTSAETPPTKSDWLSLCQNPEILRLLPENTILSIGFGMDVTVPSRTLSYPLLGLELLRRYPQMTLEMYVASQFSWLNNIDPTTASANSRILEKAISQFVQATWPDVANRVSFIPTSPLTPERLQLIDQLVPILAKDPQLNEFASNRNGFDSLRYLAAHTLYMRDPLPVDPNLYLTPPPTDNRSVTMIGGEGEKITWRARQKIAQYFNVSAPLQIFTTLGRTSPYFRYEQEPIIGEAITVPFLLSTIPEVFRDYAALLISLTDTPVDIQLNQRSLFLSQPSIQQSLNQLNQLTQP